MATRILSAHLTKKNTLKTVYKGQEVGKGGLEEIFDFENKKSTSQEVHRDLIHALDSLVPHVMFRTQLIDKSVAIPTSITDEEYFTKWHWEDDERFANMKVTGIKTFGKHAVEGVYIHAEKETEDGCIVKIVSPLISLDRSPENVYPLHVICGAQIDTLLTEIDKYIFEGKNVKTITNQTELEFR